MPPAAQQHTYLSIRKHMISVAEDFKNKNPTNNCWKSVGFRNKFFRNFPGGYGYSDHMLGYWTGADLKKFKDQTIVTKKTKSAPSSSSGIANFEKDVPLLIRDRYHEIRLLGWMMLRDSSRNSFQQLQKLNGKKPDDTTTSAALRQEHEKTLKRNFDFVMQSRHFMKNWDEVDTVATTVLGLYICHKFPLKTMSSKRLDFLAKDLQLAKTNSSLWSQRLAVVSTQAMIKVLKSDKEIFALSELFMKHEHDLMHKACGWMLREAGIYCSKSRLIAFLKKNHKKMPRVMLRYAMEKCTAAERKKYY